jgi:hypothetical protein
MWFICDLGMHRNDDSTYVGDTDKNRYYNASLCRHGGTTQGVVRAR